MQRFGCGAHRFYANRIADEPDVAAEPIENGAALAGEVELAGIRGVHDIDCACVHFRIFHSQINLGVHRGDGLGGAGIAFINRKTLNRNGLAVGGEWKCGHFTTLVCLFRPGSGCWLTQGRVCVPKPGKKRNGATVYGGSESSQLKFYTKSGYKVLY